jgi:hypothetical protein
VTTDINEPTLKFPIVATESIINNNDNDLVGLIVAGALAIIPSGESVSNRFVSNNTKHIVDRMHEKTIPAMVAKWPAITIERALFLS